MKIPKIIADLVAAQNREDSAAYAQCFVEDAVVFDENKNHIGRTAIRSWIENANEKYHSRLVALEYKEDGSEVILKVRVSGIFEGSPLDMEYHMNVSNAQIRSLKIT